MLIRAKENKFVLILVLFIIIFSGYVRLKIIKGSLPYIGHPDEPALTKVPLRILKTGDFNPHTFIWPSLPYYITTASLVLGYLNSVSNGEIENIKKIDSISYPFYPQKRLIFPAKLIFALLSIVTMLLIGIIAHNVSGNTHSIYLAPLLLTLSPLYLFHSARYLNIDIIGTFFAVLSIWYIIKRLEIDSLLTKAIIPGILCGLAIASKYNFYLILIPSALAIIFYSKKQKLGKILLLFCVAIIIFIICVPYSILDFSTFLDGIVFNINHYKSGHLGFTAIPGITQFFYYCNGLISEYGVIFMIFTLLGILYSLVSDPKRGLVLLAFPLLLLIYMSSLPVHFMRNILAVFVFVCIYCSFGIFLVFKYLSSQLRKMSFFSNKKILHKSVPILLCAVIIAISLPVKSIVNAYDFKPDSRNLSIHWIKTNLPLNSKIFIPQELDLDTRKLEKAYKIRHFNGLKLRGNFKESILSSYVLIPYYGYDQRKPAGREIALQRNRFFKEFDKIVEFGKKPVLVNYYRAVPTGNPKFYIGRIR